MSGPRHRLVARFTAQTATAVYCPACGWRGRDEDPASGLIANACASCPECGETVEYQYDEGDRCRGCGKLAAWHPVRDEHGRYCSRVCQLQAEYARTLAAREASPVARPDAQPAGLTTASRAGRKGAGACPAVRDGDGGGT